jgi:hypothetical protein
MGGERSPTGTPSPAQAVGSQVASGYMPGNTPSGCYSSVFSSFSTFLCIAANWAGVDKNIRTTGAKHIATFVFVFYEQFGIHT